ncbi:hypothetical protein KR044_013378 [Drosophila immigrans]|nr:hypothetical protein KR044_013378 [Drosophila immigrans]
MFNKCWLSFEVLIVLLGLSSALKYRLELENEEIFTPCPNQPSNVKDVTEFFDFSELQTKEVGNKIIVSGNVTSKWNYDPTDRLEGTATAFRFDRREWVNSLISVFFIDVCSDLYNKEKHWYKFWTKHIVNIKDVKNKCVLNSTKFIHETFAVDMNINVPIFAPEGRHKIVYIVKPIDNNNLIRDPILCFEVIGEVFRA